MNFKTRSNSNFNNYNKNINNKVYDKNFIIVSMSIILLLIIVIIIQQNKINNFLYFFNKHLITNQDINSSISSISNIKENILDVEKINNQESLKDKIFGIKNFCNTCYLNSSLQLIFAQINFIGEDNFFNFYYNCIDYIDDNKLNIATALHSLYHAYNLQDIQESQIINFLKFLSLDFGNFDSPIILIYNVFDVFMQKSNIFYNAKFSTELFKISTCNSESKSPLISFANIDLINHNESISPFYYGLPSSDIHKNFFIRNNDIISNSLIIKKKEYGNRSFFMTIVSDNVSIKNFEDKNSMQQFMKNIINIKQSSNPQELFQNVGKLSIPVVFEFSDGLYVYKASLLGWIETKDLHYVANILDKNTVWNVNDNTITKVLEIKSDIIHINAPYITTYGVERLI
ncbi:hypothetical protein IOLA_107 [uncultured bacterium]|nr:hypothetical protein IOLA_107 [uncultured bacterium]